MSALGKWGANLPPAVLGHIRADFPEYGCGECSGCEFGGVMGCISRAGLCLLAAVSVASCNQDGPPEDVIVTNIKTRTGDHLEFSLTKHEVAAAEGNMRLVTFKGVLTPKEPVYIQLRPAWVLQSHKLLPESNLDDLGDIIPRFIAKVGDPTAKETVFGKCTAEKIIDKWNVKNCNYDFVDFISNEKAPMIWQGKSRAAFVSSPSDGPVIELPSPEADAYLSRLAATRKQRREAIQSHVSKKQVYVGTVRASDAWTVKIHMTFDSATDDGENIRLTITAYDNRERSTFVSTKRETTPATSNICRNFPLAMKASDGPYSDVDRSANGYSYAMVSLTHAAQGMMSVPVFFKFDGDTVTGKLWDHTGPGTEYTINAKLANTSE